MKLLQIDLLKSLLFLTLIKQLGLKSNAIFLFPQYKGIEPTIKGLKEMGTNYKGFLYAGLMIIKKWIMLYVLMLCL
mgnify:CR=1 FL=1